MKSIWTNVKKEIYLQYRTKMLYFLLIIIIGAGIFMSYYLNGNFESSLEQGDGVNISLNNLLFLNKNHHLFLGLSEYVDIIFPIICVIFAINIFNVDYISGTRRSKYTYQSYKHVFVAKNIVVTLFTLITIILFLISYKVSSLIMIEKSLSDFTDTIIVDISFKTIITTCLSIFLFGLIISFAALLLMTLIKNFFVVMFLMFSYMFAVPIVLKDLRFHIYGLYTSNINLYDDKVLKEFYINEYPFQSEISLFISLFIISVLLYGLWEVLKWQEKY